MTFEAMTIEQYEEIRYKALEAFTALLDEARAIKSENQYDSRLKIAQVVLRTKLKELHEVWNLGDDEMLSRSDAIHSLY